MKTTDLVAAVRAHAIAHYTADGWDYVVECYSGDEIANLILAAGAGTVEQAIAAVHADIAPYHDYCEDIRGHGGCNDDNNLPCAFEPADDCDDGYLEGEKEYLNILAERNGYAFP